MRRGGRKSEEVSEVPSRRHFAFLLPVAGQSIIGDGSQTSQTTLRPVRAGKMS